MNIKQIKIKFLLITLTTLVSCRSFATTSNITQGNTGPQNKLATKLGTGTQRVRKQKQKSKRNSKQKHIQTNTVLAVGGVATVLLAAAYLCGTEKNPDKMPEADNKTPKTDNKIPNTDNKMPKAKKDESLIIDFYSNKQGVDVGSSKDLTWQETINILKNNNGTTDVYGSPLFEFSHCFIQWLFPTIRASDFKDDPELLNAEIIAKFKSSPELINRLIESYIVVIHGYYKLNVKITNGASHNCDVIEISVNESNYDETKKALLINGRHNLRRITRILDSMNTLGLKNYAQAFFSCLTQMANRPDIKTKLANALTFWKDLHLEQS